MVLLIHGGGWAFGSIEETEPLARYLAAESGAVVVSTSYRLAPEHPFPAGLHDCEATLRWIQAEGSKHGGDPSRLAIGGGSAGGNLAAVVAQRAARRPSRRSSCSTACSAIRSTRRHTRSSATAASASRATA